jgi:hypothetical protein
MKQRTVRRLAWVGVALCPMWVALGVTERLVEPTSGVKEAKSVSGATTTWGCAALSMNVRT